MIAERRKKWWFILIWITLLALFCVWQIKLAIHNISTFQTVGFANSPIPVSVQSPRRSVVPMGSSTVWIIDQDSDQITVITRNPDGSFSSTSSNYQKK